MGWGEHYWGMHAMWWIFWMVAAGAFLLWALPGQRPPSDDAALNELRRRYAAGELDDDEFYRRVDVLQQRTRASRSQKDGDATA